jgi:hypothetical protein
MWAECEDDGRAIDAVSFATQPVNKVAVSPMDAIKIADGDGALLPMDWRALEIGYGVQVTQSSSIQADENPRFHTGGR